ncbi:ABC transporter ATP-binding protein [Fusibacter tunisiensis]|uniref:ABC-2 type transport system ATP-binding protein n=1 Tax=Fusibacter tunisiensis TaxID=1008308 RepID=A0ABS2MPS0_9FIRM|nr:ABC transporter ATP-binding protein [Fusibacter tunisiensis]MBM7561380.1 ABC-2 type transport system ATP-binding protein [Fusibacter tunisiensis]
MNCIEINQLTKYYSKVKGIEDVSFQVREGEIFGFIGPNGAGKSTTIRTLLGLIFPTSGSATIFGKDCITQGHEIRKDIGYLPSEVFYYEKMKVIDLLKYAGSFYKKDCSKRIYELSEIMELNLNRRIEDLSYGNKKKVGIVQGLLHEPKLIVLDEPTSGLDPLMQQRFFELIKSENKKGASVFFSSHILSEVQHLCNRVAIIKGGHVIQVEDVKTLREDTYKKITLIGESIDLKTFEIEGVTELNKSDHQLDFFYKGDVNLLVNKIQSLELKDILVENPSLEEIFMHYYK